MRLLINGRPPVYTPALKVTLTIPQHAGGMHGALLLPKDLTGMEPGMTVQMESGVHSVDKDNLVDGEYGLRNTLHSSNNGYLDGYEDGSQQPSERHWDSEGEDEFSEEEVGILFQATSLVMERDEETLDSNVESDEDSDIDTEGKQEGDNYDHDYIPDKI